MRAEAGVLCYLGILSNGVLVATYTGTHSHEHKHEKGEVKHNGMETIREVSINQC